MNATNSNKKNAKKEPKGAKKINAMSNKPGEVLKEGNTQNDKNDNTGNNGKNDKTGNNGNHSEKVTNNNDNHDDNYSTYLGEKGYSIFKECLSVEEQHYIRNELIMKPFIPKSPIQPTPFPIYLESPLKLYMPRYFGLDTYGEPDRILIQPGNNISLSFEGELRPYQTAIVDKYIKHVGKCGGGLLDVDPGKGKTVMALNIVAQLGKCTLVIVHKSFLLNQWIERIEQFLPGARVGRIQGQIMDTENKDIVIGMLQSLSMKEYPKNTFRQFGLAIYDECFPRNTLVHTSCGLIEIGTLYDMWLESSISSGISGKFIRVEKDVEKLIDRIPKILSFNQSTERFEWGQMTHAWKRQRKELLKVYLMCGSFVCTPEHKILTTKEYKCAKENKILTRKEYKCAQDLRIGDYIECMHNATEKNDISSFELYKALTPKGMLTATAFLYTENYIPPSTPEAEKIFGKSEHGYDVFDIEVKDNHNFVLKMADGLRLYPIVSNCHHMGAEVFSRCMMKVNTTYTLGLSGTMERKDGLTKVFEMFIGPVVHKEKTESEHSVLVKGIVYNVDDEEFNETQYDYKGNPKFSTMISKLCNYNHRSEVILRVVHAELELNPEQQIMILAHNKSLITYLHDAIAHRKIGGGSVGYYIGGMKEAALKQSESKKIIIATYAMASEGLDIKTLTSLILASPKTDVCQSVGRILRQKHSSPLVIDIIDAHDIFMSQWYKRRKYYKSQNYKILVCDNADYDAGYNKDISKWKISWEPKSKDGGKSVSKKIHPIQNIALQLNIATSATKRKESEQNKECQDVEEEDDGEDEEQEHEKKRNETRGKLGLSGKGCLVDMSIFN
jgi:superfamily II DNA or RNA helicase